MKKIVTDNEELLRWFAEKTGKPVAGMAQAIGLAVGGEIRAAFVFNCYTGDDAEVSAVVEPKTALPRAFLRRLVRYAFAELKCCRVSATTESHATAAKLQRFGFAPEGLKRHAFGRNRDGILLGLYPERAIVR